MEALPAAPQTLALYLAELAETRTVATVRRGIVAIARQNALHGHPRSDRGSDRDAPEIIASSVSRLEESNDYINASKVMLSHMVDAGRSARRNPSPYDFDGNGDCRKCGWHASSQPAFRQGNVVCLAVEETRAEN